MPTDQKAPRLTPAQRTELERRLDSYAADRNRGRPVSEVLADIRERLSSCRARTGETKGDAKS